MKKIFLLLLICIGSISYAQQKIGNISDKNILEITYINNSLIYSYVEESTGLISIKKQYFCNINGKIYGPFTKQPEIKNLKLNYHIKTVSNNSFGCIIDNVFYESDDYVSEVLFNEDKTNFAFICRINDKDNLILNGKIIATEYRIYDLNFLTDETLCYMIEEITDNDSIYYYLLVDGNEYIGR